MEEDMTEKDMTSTPTNWIEGDLTVEITVNAHNKIADAKAMGLMYRGLENIFIGQRPFDAMRMSQRADAACSTANGTAGALAIERMMGFKPPRNGQLIRDIVLGASIAANHLTHFYFTLGPGLASPEYKKFKMHHEMQKRFDPSKSALLKDVLRKARMPLHRAIAIFGGRSYHPMHAVPGGVCSIPKYSDLAAASTSVAGAKEFLEENLLGGVKMEEWARIRTADELLELLKDKAFADSDIGLFIRYSQEIGLHKLGEGTHNNFLSFGFGENKHNNGIDSSPDSWLFKPGYVENGQYHDLDIQHITEDTSHSYYETERDWRSPQHGMTKPIPRKEGAYSWVKSPRYFGRACEVGPLARQIVNADLLCMDLVKTFGVNTFTRTLARFREITLIVPKLKEWIAEIELEKPFYKPFPEVSNGSGYGLVESPRGALGHWINIKEGKCTTYQMISPIDWNASPIDSNGAHGALEQALIGCRIKDKDSLIEASLVVKGFDSCIACSIRPAAPGDEE
ncbi:nickel-dependent hydrogenase large subunit [Candidatus Woesearchaeota archaeon]|nr:nickel-dependent hydrogenase large subunit [Candidatus Woesearchaeota archaeon]